jgi:hypothetical protein
MPLLNSILNRIPPIVTLYSNLGVEFTRYQTGQIDFGTFLAATEENRTALTIKTKELIDLLSGETAEVDLARNCADLAGRVDNQANSIVAGITQDNKTAISSSLLRIESNTLTLLSRLSTHYEYLAENSQKDHSMVECLKKAFKLIAESPPPMFEEEVDQYENIVSALKVSYSTDERLLLNKRVLRFPGMTSFLSQLSNIDLRNSTLNLAKNFTPQNCAALDPLPMNIHDLIIGAKVFDTEGFASLDEARTDIVNFFRNGHWLECYIFLMLERAGCSTKILNAKLSLEQIEIEADVLALYANNLIIFDSKDRMFSNGLSADDVNAIKSQVEKVAGLKNNSIKLNYVFNVADRHKQTVESKVQEIASASGIDSKILFLDNQGLIDNIIAKLRTCLR